MHDEDGEAQAEDVGCEAGVEVSVRVLLQAAGDGGGRARGSARAEDGSWGALGALSASLELDSGTALS